VKTLLAKIWRFLRFPKLFQLFIMRIMQDQFLVGVTGIIFNDKDEILVFKHSYREVRWSLPGGYMKAREHPAEALEREIMEESGFTVSADTQHYLKTDRDTARLEMCFVGKFIGGEFKKSAEVTDYGFFAIDALPLIPKKQLLLIQEAHSSRVANRKTNKLNLLDQWKAIFRRKV
jgi:8-oxo-dGTP diphosphatase